MLGDLTGHWLTDFVAFDRAAYDALAGRADAGWSVAPQLLTLIGFALLVAAIRAPLHPATGRVVSAGLAIAFALTAWLWFLGAYDALTEGAVVFALAFFVQAGLLVVAGIARDTFRSVDTLTTRSAFGAIGVVLGLVGVPLTQWLVLGRPFDDLSWFGFAPTPTAVAALGFVAMAESRSRYLAAVVPVLWLVIDAVTYLGLGAPTTALVPAFAAVFGIVIVLLPAGAATRLGDRIDRGREFAPLSPSNVVNAKAGLAGRMRRTPAISLMPTLTPTLAPDKREQIAEGLRAGPQARPGFSRAASPND